MDGTTLGSLLVGVGTVAGALVALVGKRSENAITGYSSLTDNLQKEIARRDTRIGELEQKVADRDARLSELGAHRAADQAEIARLRGEVIRLGGQP